MELIRRLAWDRGGRWNLLAMGVVYLVFGWSMHFQAVRWTRTPAYHDLFQLLPESVWGSVYLASGALLLLAAYWSRQYWLTMLAVVFGLMISVSWSAAFVVRVVTSANTTPETFMSFLIFSYLLVRVLLLLEHGGMRPGPDS